MGLATTTVKHLLLLLNFIFAVLGIVLIGFGIYFLVNTSENAVSHGESVVGGLIIALGLIILILSIFGCLAAIHEAPKRLLIYVVCVSVLILVQLLMLSMASHGTKDGLSGSIQEGFDMLWEEELKTPGALAYYEDWLHCCGVNNTEDYVRAQHLIPVSCCKGHICGLASNRYTEGCLTKFEEYLTSQLLTFKIVCWLLIIGEAIAAFFGWALFSSLKNQSRRDNVGWM